MLTIASIPQNILLSNPSFQNQDFNNDNINVGGTEILLVHNTSNVNTNILIIDVGKNSHINEQYDSPTIPIFTFKIQVLINVRMHHLVQNNQIPNVRALMDHDGCPYSDSVLRDFLRCRAIEKMYPHTLIHSVQMCTDGIRDSIELSQHEMNNNCNHRNFIKTMEAKNWKIDEIYLDYYRMSNSYLTDVFNVVFL